MKIQNIMTRTKSYFVPKFW